MSLENYLDLFAIPPITHYSNSGLLVEKDTVKADFHIHSCFSEDSFLKPKLIVKHASKKGLKVIAITDHNSLKGSNEAIKVANETKSNLIVINGMEVSTDFGHVIGLFLEEEIKNTLFPEVIDEIKQQGGLSIIAHPSRKPSKFESDQLTHADLLEVLNGRSTIKQNHAAAKLALDLGKTAVAGSDAHTPFELGRVWTTLPWHPSDKDELRHMLEQGLVIDNNSTVDTVSPYLMHSLSICLELTRKVFQ